METVTIFTEGGSRGDPGPAAVGAQLVGADGVVLGEVSEIIGNASNNFAEYFAVMRALQIAKELFGEQTNEIQFELKLDNELVKKQLNGEYQIKEPGLVPLFIEIHNMRITHFPNFMVTQVQREFNKEANRLVNEALDAK